MKSKFRKNKFHKPGTSPGTLLKPDIETEGEIHFIQYSAGDFQIEKIQSIERINEKISTEKITWINFLNISNSKTIQKIGEIFHIHQLALEDLTQPGQRPKFDFFDKYYYINFSRITNISEQIFNDINIFYSGNLVLTFIEDSKNPFEVLIERIKSIDSRHRKYGSDYLVYSMIDFLIDEFFPLLDSAGERIEELELELLEQPTRKTYEKIYKLKRELFLIRRIIWAEREIINRINFDLNASFTESTKIYLKDCYDHAIQIMDLVETFRDLLTNMVDVYLSSVSNKMNEVMKVLTIIATIFMPLSFLASLYGMNFNTEKSPFNMPELNWFFGYPFALSLMFLSSMIMLLYFKKKGWFD